MKHWEGLRQGRLVIGAAALALAIGSGPWYVLDASAHVSHCRTDPIVRLSNGNQLNLTADINGLSSNVTGIAYTAHVPAGVTVTGETFTGGPLSGKETVAVSADAPANTYTTSFLVSYTASAVSVTDSITLSNSRDKVITSQAVAGLTGQTVTLSVRG